MSSELSSRFEAIVRLFDEVRLLNNLLVSLAEDLHADRAVSVPQRAILEFLDRHGPHPVPAIARARNVTRQHIQALANELLDLGLIEQQPNPAHRRSPLLALTSSGQQTISDMLDREAVFVRHALEEFDLDGLEQVATTLAAVRQALT